MNLTIDIGNSNIKISKFENNKFIELLILHNELDIIKFLQSEVNNTFINSIIICSVSENISELLLSVARMVKNFIVFSHKTPVPIINVYSSPKTLGLDRLAAAVGAFTIFPNKNCLIVDAGTAITFDLLNNKGEYLGGAISPGLTIRYKALSHFTKKLPELEFTENLEYPGKNTINSIHTGVQSGILYETEGYICNLEKYYSDLHVLVTGGDVNFLVRNLKKPIFTQPNLVAIGLQRIIQFNEKNP